MRLFFLRHGDAELSGSTADSERNLSPEGVVESENAARGAQTLNLAFSTILSSPLARAHQTAAIVARVFPGIVVQEFERITPTADPQNLFSELQSFPRDSRILLVSHEPFISKCIASLISGISEPRVSIRKASLACVEVGSPVQRGAGVLLWLLSNEQMKLIAHQ